MRKPQPAIFFRRLLLVMSMVGLLIGGFSIATAKLTGSLEESAIAERLKPVGEVSVDGAVDTAAAAAAWGPEVIYKKTCRQCHRTGLSGAPKWGKKSDWTGRLSQGIDTMTSKAWAGFKAMPPKGNCLKCTQEDLKATIEYMVDALK